MAKGSKNRMSTILKRGEGKNAEFAPIETKDSRVVVFPVKTRPEFKGSKDLTTRTLIAKLLNSEWLPVTSVERLIRKEFSNGEVLSSQEICITLSYLSGKKYHTLGILKRGKRGEAEYRRVLRRNKEKDQGSTKPKPVVKPSAVEPVVEAPTESLDVLHSAAGLAIKVASLEGRIAKLEAEREAIVVGRADEYAASKEALVALKDKLIELSES